MLIVEDEAMIATMLEDFLQTLGHRVHGIAASVDQACTLAREGGFDYAILDCNLGGSPVWPAAAILARNHVPFLISSGGSLSDIPAEYADRPGLEKPYTMIAVEQALRRMSLAA